MSKSIFDVPPPKIPRPEDEYEDEVADGLSDKCGHQWMLTQKDEYRWRQDSLRTVFTYTCPDCGMVFTNET